VRELHARALNGVRAGLLPLLLVAGIAGPAGTSSAGSLAKSACSLPDRYLVRIARGTDPQRSGDLQLVPRGQDFVGAGFPHAGPNDHLQDVPLLLYGPGVIQPGRVVERPVTSADIAPTAARLAGFDLSGVDGVPLEEALVPGAPAPTLIVTMVWDGAGHVVLDEYRRAWPELRALKREGTWYSHATVGSSPSTSAAIHATIGTGTYPRRHGLVGNALRVGGRIADPWDEGPAYLIEPALADRYDAANGNAPLVGMVGSSPIQLALIGHGSMWEGGDADIAALKQVGGPGDSRLSWGLPPNSSPFYAFPDYVNELPPISSYFGYADALDGRKDGRWLGEPIGSLRGGFDTPARVPFETRAMEEIIRREAFGDDAVPDLFSVNYKLIDFVGHEWSMNSPQMRHAVRAQDEELPRLVELLDQEVGPGRWVLILTADHGHTPDPRVSGAWRINDREIAARITATFDDGDARRVVQQVQPTQVFVNEAELRQNGAGLKAVAAMLGRLTRAQTAVGGTRPPPGTAGARVFSSVFPSGLLARLPCLPDDGTG